MASKSFVALLRDISSHTSFSQDCGVNKRIENQNYDIVIQLSSISSFRNLLVRKSLIGNNYCIRP